MTSSSSAGDPAAPTTATMLARQGHRVVLFERERFPRPHRGVTAPGDVPILEALGVRDGDRSGRLPAPSSAPPWSGATTRRRGAGTSARRTSATPTLTRCGGPSSTRSCWTPRGAPALDVREGSAVASVRFDGGRASGRAATDDGASVDADFVVDASGQRALVGHALGLRRWDRDFRNMAVYGYFEGAGRLDQPNETNILVESYGEGWFWVIPLHVGVVSVGAVVDAATARSGCVATPLPSSSTPRSPGPRSPAGCCRPPRSSTGPTRCATGPTRPTEPWATAGSSWVTPPASSTRCSPRACTSPCRRG